MAEIPSSSIPSAAERPQAPSGGWGVAAGHGARWWSHGWTLFAAAPMLWIGMMVVVMVLFMAMTFVPVLGHIAATLLYPVVAAGLIVGARDQDRGEALSLRHLLACFDHRLGQLVLVAILYLALW